MALLLLLSPVAVWYVEEERPRRVVDGITATASVRRATAEARRTATAQVRLTATAIAIQNPDIRLRVINDPDGERLHIYAQSHLPFGGRLEIVIYDDDQEERKTFVLTIPENERGYLRLEWKYPFSGNVIPRMSMIDRIEGIFKPTRAESEALRCVKHSASFTEYRYSCNFERGSRVAHAILRTVTASIHGTEAAIARQTATEPVNVHLTVNAANRSTATAIARTATARARLARWAQTQTAEATLQGRATAGTNPTASPTASGR